MNKIQQLEKQFHFQTYNRFPVTLSHGKGALVWDSEGNEYLDALAGIAVNNLGHCHPKVVEAIQNQAEKLIHTSNFYYTEEQSCFIEKLAEVSRMDRIFLGNSGVEAMEGAIKLARKYGHTKGKTGNIISLTKGFHGRSLTTIVMGMPNYQKGFEPMPQGFEQVPFNDFEALKAAANADTIAIVFELVQGNSGVHVADPEFVKQVRALCDELDILLIFDEIQTGIGRTGKFFAYQHYGVKPDIMTLAKALAGGIPIGALLANNEVASVLGAGEHGTTFGGNPFACAVGLATLKAIEEEGIVEQAAKKGEFMMTLLREKTAGIEAVKDIRGLGLMIGVELNKPARPVVDKMFEKKVLSNAASGNVIRLVPPLVITEEQIEKVVDVLVNSI